jgi:hypothetical protein
MEIWGESTTLRRVAVSGRRLMRSSLVKWIITAACALPLLFARCEAQTEFRSQIDLPTEWKVQSAQAPDVPPSPQDWGDFKEGADWRTDSAMGQGTTWQKPRSRRRE